MNTPLGQSGEVQEFRNEHLKYKGVRTNWKVGARTAVIKKLTKKIPPWAVITYEGKEYPITLWHYGMQEMKCRFCDEIVPRGHDCPLYGAPRAERPGKSCYKCGQEGHIARNCRGNTVNNAGTVPQRNRPSTMQNRQQITTGTPSSGMARKEPVIIKQNITMEARVQQENNSEQNAPITVEAQVHRDPDEIRPEPAEDSFSELMKNEGPSPQVHTLKVVGIGASNMRGIKIKGDEELTIDFNNIYQPGLKIEEAHEKMEELNEKEVAEASMVVLNVGACNFNERDEEPNDTDIMLEDYKELLGETRRTFPKAEIIISSIIPRGRDGTENQVINENIMNLNVKLHDLATEQNGNGVYFCNNYQHLWNDRNAIDQDLYRDEIHLRPKGQEKLAQSISERLKMIYVANRLLPKVMETRLGSEESESEGSRQEEDEEENEGNNTEESQQMEIAEEIAEEASEIV